MLGEEITHIFVSNYMYEIDWLLRDVPQLFAAHSGVLVHGERSVDSQVSYCLTVIACS